MLATTTHVLYFLGGAVVGIGAARAAHLFSHGMQMRRMGVRGQANPASGPPSVLTPRDIIAEIQQVPVLQQPHAAKSYRGMSVRWQVSFESAFVSGLTTLRLMCQDRGNYPWVNCDVRRWAYPEINTLLPHAPLWITGTISHVGTEEIFLRHVRLSFDT